eukprot:6314254-Amphidinium_carterae.1
MRLELRLRVNITKGTRTVVPSTSKPSRLKRNSIECDAKTTRLQATLQRSGLAGSIRYHSFSRFECKSDVCERFYCQMRLLHQLSNLVSSHLLRLWFTQHGDTAWFSRHTAVLLPVSTTQIYALYMLRINAHAVHT